VATGLIRDGDQDEPATLHLPDQVLHHRQLGRVHEIVGGIDREERRRDFLEVLRGVVVFRRAEVIDHVVRVGVPHARRDLIGEVFVRRRSGGELFLPLHRCARGDQQEPDRARHPARRLGVVAVLPCRVIDDRVDERFAPEPVAAGDFHGVAGERHQSTSEIRIHVTPHPAVHRAHRRAHYETQVRQSKPFRHQEVLQRHHVGVSILREPHAKPVARLARLAVSEVVRQNDEVLLRVEQLALAEQPAGIALREKGAAGAARSVQDQDGVADHAVGILPRCTQRAVVDPDLGQRLAALEREVPGHEIGFDGRRISLRSDASRQRQDEQTDRKAATQHPATLPHRRTG